MNTVENIAALFAIGMFLIIFAIMFSIGDTLFNSAYNTFPEEVRWNVIMNNLVNVQSDLSDLFIDAAQFITYLLIALTIFSTFTQKNSIISYAISFICSILIGALVSYILIMMYNQFVEVYAEAGFNPEYMMSFFFQNFSSIVLANIVAGILSFVWIKREGAV